MRYEGVIVISKSLVFVCFAHIMKGSKMNISSMFNYIDIPTLSVLVRQAGSS